MKTFFFFDICLRTERPSRSFKQTEKKGFDLVLVNLRLGYQLFITANQVWYMADSTSECKNRCTLVMLTLPQLERGLSSGKLEMPDFDKTLFQFPCTFDIFLAERCYSLFVTGRDKLVGSTWNLYFLKVFKVMIVKLRLDCSGSVDTRFAWKIFVPFKAGTEMSVDKILACLICTTLVAQDKITIKKRFVFWKLNSERYIWVGDSEITKLNILWLSNILLLKTIKISEV